MMGQRRSGVRIRVELPAQIRWKSRGGSYRQAEGKTENISGNGMLIALPTRLQIDTPITVTMVLPPVVSKVPVELECQGRVVRWNRPGELRGIAATIDDYELRPRPRRV